MEHLQSGPRMVEKGHDPPRCRPRVVHPQEGWKIQGQRTKGLRKHPFRFRQKHRGRGSRCPVMLDWVTCPADAHTSQQHMCVMCWRSVACRNGLHHWGGVLPEGRRRWHPQATGHSPTGRWPGSRRSRRCMRVGSPYTSKPAGAPWTIGGSQARGALALLLSWIRQTMPDGTGRR